jgi:hypothetical protein
MVSVEVRPNYEVPSDPTRAAPAVTGDTLGRTGAGWGQAYSWGSPETWVAGMGASGVGLPRTSNPTGVTPPWLASVQQALIELLDLREGWNSYRAHPIAREAVVEAARLLASTMQTDTPPPSVIPTPPGGVQLEWHLRGMDVEVEIAPQGQVRLVYEDEVTGTRSNEAVTDGRAPLRVLLVELSRRRD